MNVSSSLTRCGVLVTYLFHIPWRMSCALPLLAGFVDRAGVEVVVVVWGAVEPVVRCLGGIVRS
jgi:hypothetical protein